MLISHSQKVPISHEENGLHGFFFFQTCQNHVVLKGKKNQSKILFWSKGMKSQSPVYNDAPKYDVFMNFLFFLRTLTFHNF